MPLHKIGAKDIEHFLAVNRQEASEWTARKYYLALSAAFETAKRWGHVPGNPLRSVAKPKVSELQPVYFSRTDFGKLISAIRSTDLRELVLFAVSTGFRLGEILALRWDDVDLQRRVVQVRNSEVFTSKSKRNRAVPMTEALCKMLEVRQQRAGLESPYVFQRDGQRWTPDNLSHVFKRCVRAAELNDRLHFHCLRHTFVSWLAQEGVSLFVIQKLLGHSSSMVTQVYSHLQPEQLHDTVNKI